MEPTDILFVFDGSRQLQGVPSTQMYKKLLKDLGGTLQISNSHTQVSCVYHQWKKFTMRLGKICYLVKNSNYKMVKNRFVW